MCLAGTTAVVPERLTQTVGGSLRTQGSNSFMANAFCLGEAVSKNEDKGGGLRVTRWGAASLLSGLQGS